MKKTAIILVISLLASLSQAAAYAIEGNWGAQNTDSGFHFDITFAIQNQRLVLTNVCSYAGRSVAAQVSVAVSYDTSTLTMLESASKSAVDGGLDCHVDVQGGDQMQYQVQGSTLIFTKPGQPGALVLQRK